MEHFLEVVNNGVKRWDWRDPVLLKLCAGAVGVLIGLAIPARRKRPAAWVAALVFLAAYIPLMARFLPFLTRHRIEDIYD